jgi:hypothetical protein
MAVASDVTPLKVYRLGLIPKVSQESMARKSAIVLQTYRNAESGNNCSYSTASAILRALNTERISRGMKPVGLDQLGLAIV